jgi:hypothetical protein
MEQRSKCWELLKVADSGVGFKGNANGTDHKKDSIALEVGAVVYSNRAGVIDRGPHRQVALGHVPKVFRGPTR